MEIEVGHFESEDSLPKGAMTNEPAIDTAGFTVKARQRLL